MNDLSVEPWLFVDTDLRFDNSSLADFVEYWRARARGRPCPSRNDIDLAELRRYMGDMFLIDVAGPPDEFVYRLIGTRIVEAGGGDAAGLTVYNVFGRQNAEPVLRTYRYVTEQIRPLRYHGVLSWQDRDFRHYESVLLPLAEEGAPVNMLIGAMYTWTKGAA